VPLLQEAPRHAHVVLRLVLGDLEVAAMTTKCPKCRERARSGPGELCRVCQKEYNDAYRKMHHPRQSPDYSDEALHRMANKNRPAEQGTET